MPELLPIEENSEDLETLRDDDTFAEPPTKGSRQEPRPRAFGRRLSTAFAAVAALTAILAGLLLSAAWNYQFDRYVQSNLKAWADFIAQTVEGTYPNYGYSYITLARIPPIQGVGVQIVDQHDQLVYDQASMQQHMQQLLQGGMGSAFSPNIKTPSIVLRPVGQTVSSPIIVNGQTVGSVRLWPYGTTALLTDRDIQFRRGSFEGLAIAALVAIALAAAAGAFYSRRLVEPIVRITETAEALQAGNHQARTGLTSNDELGFLGKTFDAMADSIEADRELERRLTADVAHELRTPLQAIQATVEAMQDGVLPADEERLGIVRDETRRLSRLADGILELTRLERGSVPFDVRRMDAAGSVHAAVDSLEALIETCELTLSGDIASHVWVNADRDRLTQAVTNLVSNAARYTPAGGHVEVALRRDGSSAVISVADTGIGIAEEDLQRVFSRFWRADGARATASGGLGIGLAVTKEIVERLGGTIAAGPRPDGARGTVFAIRLPLA
jgi:two-component system sensor histidine kinase BaeS